MNRNVRGVFCTLAGGLMWGFSGTCSQYLFTNYQVESGWLTAVRMLGAGAMLLTLCLFTRKEKLAGIWKNGRDGLQLVLFGIFGLLFSQYTYLTSISHSNAGTATVLQYLGPVMIMILVCVRRRQAPNPRETAAVLMAVLGTFLLATHGNINTMVMSSQALIWGLLSAVGLACYTLLPSKLIPRWGSMAVTGFGMLIGGIVMALVMKVWVTSVVLDGKGLLALAGVVIIGTLGAYTMYLQGVADIGAVRASMLASIEPVAATVFSVVWMKTRFQLIDLLGFGCIMTTVFLLTKKKEEKHD